MDDGEYSGSQGHLSGDLRFLQLNGTTSIDNRIVDVTSGRMLDQ